MKGKASVEERLHIMLSDFTSSAKYMEVKGQQTET